MKQEVFPQVLCVYQTHNSYAADHYKGTDVQSCSQLTGQICSIKRE